ncbi:nuclear transport factor 2 family protein [Amycolatopsis rubida]|uniref:SnoaL-like domain-containing protein n=1 Tax=Amycolatopsis rubida TaxID=112413 RepID=A0A1I5KK21_9PSEU|nr:nuclear transport factor 2 family protein [Amycolatopsis rubida]SFO84901.1 SnoaL-like domain-containing protein [Amycolatopsis rubida]
MSEISEVVLLERTARDTARWDLMASAFAPGAKVELSWFSGTGEEFAAASRRMHERGSRSFHTLGAVSSQVVGDRALASENCTVHTTATLAGVELNLASHGRLFQRLLRTGGEWRISELTMLYCQDVVTLANPADDPSPLAGYSFPFDRP